MEKAKRLPIGISEFRNIIENGGYYVDKTLLIADWLQSFRGGVTLITRPRRFGKTLNMTMLRAFFDMTQDSRDLFAGLAIAKTGYMAEMNQYPVIYLSLKDCKGGMDEMLRCLFRQLLEVYQTGYDQLQPDSFDKARLERIVDVLLNEKTAEHAAVNNSILFLCKLLYEHHGKKVLLLIDEYDTPMVSAYEGGYYEDVRSFFRSLYGTALKDNPYLERAMLTGIHRMAKENIFSGLNNLEVCTVIDEKYQQYFGLTPEETETLLQDYGLALDESVKSMYDGYCFGGQDIYNPWSIINYADKKRLVPYWVNTASDELLSQMIVSADKQTQKNFEQLLAQGSAVVTVDLQTSFFELNKPATLWGMFISSGYLTTETMLDINTWQAEVRIPNQEITVSFRKIVERYGGFTADSLANLFGALLRKDIENFRIAYEQIILTCTSFHDGSAENAYHMLFLGMCVYLSGSYTIKSNIESGHGRADIRLEAKRAGIPHVIIEFKQGEDVEKLAKEALVQIHEQQYAAGLTGETLLLGIAHHLKQCQIVAEEI